MLDLKHDPGHAPPSANSQRPGHVPGVGQFPPMVSVCIANYNGMGVIDECLRSVMAQLGNIAMEILLHDDASTDESLAHIKKHYPQVILMESVDNVGFCIANNRMAERARGQYLLLFNNDAALFPDALQTLLTEAQRLAKPAILTLPQFDATGGQLVDRGCLLDPFFNPVPNLDPKRSDVAMVIGACLWIPKDLWNELEGFPEWFGSIAEDMYLCCRARLAGYAVRALDPSGYRHWQGKSFGGNRVVNNRLTTTYARRALSERNKSFVMMVTCPGIMLQVLLPIHLIQLTAEGIILSIIKRDWRLFQTIYWSCLKALWQDRKKIGRLRHNIQSHRKIGIKLFCATFQPFPHKLSMLLRHGLPHVA